MSRLPEEYLKPGHKNTWKIHNGRKFGKKYGSKGGKARWASMSKYEKDMFIAKREYARERQKKARTVLAKGVSIRPAGFPTPSKQSLEDFEDFFGEIL